MVIHPIRFGEELLGTVEVDHPKRHVYGAKELLALNTLSAQMATAIHIAELRRPLLSTVDQIGHQVSALVRVTESLRASASALADASQGMRHGASELERFVADGLRATGSLSDASRAMAAQGAEAAASGAELERAIRELGEVATDLQRIARHFVVEG